MKEPQKFIDQEDDPFLQGKYRMSEFTIIAIAVMVIAVMWFVIHKIMTRKPPPPPLPSASEKKPTCNASAYSTGPYKVIKLRVYYVGQGEEFGDRYDRYELKGSIVRPTERVAGTARLFIVMRCGLLTIKKVTHVVSRLKVGVEEPFTVQFQDETYARLRSTPLDFIVMADQEGAKPPFMP